MTNSIITTITSISLTGYNLNLHQYDTNTIAMLILH